MCRMNCDIELMRFLHAGHPGTTVLGPSLAKLGSASRKVEKSWRPISTCKPGEDRIFSLALREILEAVSF